MRTTDPTLTLYQQSTVTAASLAGKATNFYSGEDSAHRALLVLDSAYLPRAERSFSHTSNAETEKSRKCAEILFILLLAKDRGGKTVKGRAYLPSRALP